MSVAFQHESVMCTEMLEALMPRAGGMYADATLGGGGHARAILDASAPDGRMVAIDRDPDAVAHGREFLASYGDRARVVHGVFGDIASILAEQGTPRVDGLVADLGVSSPQFDRPERGFSFAGDGPLDMRMDPSAGQTLAELLDSVDETELADLIYRYGEERRSRRIARAIVRARDEGSLSGTASLRDCVARALGGRRGARVDPATRTFQALRIAVNDELGQVEALLEALPDVLKNDGVAAVISFHSLEDRMVKRCFRDHPNLQPLYKKVRVASDEERASNGRSRSAKLRAARRVVS